MHSKPLNILYWTICTILQVIGKFKNNAYKACAICGRPLAGLLNLYVHCSEIQKFWQEIKEIIENNCKLQFLWRFLFCCLGMWIGFIPLRSLEKKNNKLFAKSIFLKQLLITRRWMTVIEWISTINTCISHYGRVWYFCPTFWAIWKPWIQTLSLGKKV